MLGDPMRGFLLNLYVSCGLISSTCCKLALEAKEGSFGFPECHQIGRKLNEVGAALLATPPGWGFGLIPSEKQASGCRFPLGFCAGVQPGRVGVARLPGAWPGCRGGGQAAEGVARPPRPGRL